jgi:uncharacterized protein
MKPNKTEDEYVWVQELQDRLARMEQKQQAQSRAEKARLKELHWMRCPKCGQQLVSEECDSVEIDVCPSCKGVWLDAGELGTIVENTGSFFHSCLRVIRGGRHKSPHLAPRRTASQPG